MAGKGGSVPQNCFGIVFRFLMQFDSLDTGMVVLRKKWNVMFLMCHMQQLPIVRFVVIEPYLVEVEMYLNKIGLGMVDVVKYQLTIGHSNCLEIYPGLGRAPQLHGDLHQRDRALHADLPQRDRALHAELPLRDRAWHGDLPPHDRALHGELHPGRALHGDDAVLQWSSRSTS